MKATGVVRRIDELGRIVIPKELRKSLHIKEGENLEIFTTDAEKIVLKKFSQIKNINDIADLITDSIYEITKVNTFIFDNDSIVSYSGKDKKNYLNKNMDANIGEMLNNNIKINDIFFGNKKSENINYLYKLIRVNGDIVGGIISFSENILENYINDVLEIFSLFLSKYLE